MQHAGLCPAGSFRHASRATFLPEEGNVQTSVLFFNFFQRLCHNRQRIIPPCHSERNPSCHPERSAAKSNFCGIRKSASAGSRTGAVEFFRPRSFTASPRAVILERSEESRVATSFEDDTRTEKREMQAL